MDESFQCRICFLYKTKSDFSKNPNNKNGIDKRCKSCRKDHYNKNRDSILEKIKRHADSNRESIRERRRINYSRNKADIRSKAREKRNNNPDSASKEKEYKDNRRLLAYRKLGDTCKLCGESDHALLCIDHIHNDGSQERKNGVSRIRIFGDILKGSDRYQLLCYNCNQKKQIEHHLCRKPLGLGVHKECPTCRTSKDRSFFKSDKKYADGLYYECIICTYDRVRILKIQAFNCLGSSTCVKCGCSDSDVLSIDHVNEDGFYLRRKEGRGVSLYSNIIHNRIETKHLQVLCFNCNLKKHKSNADSDLRLPERADDVAPLKPNPGPTPLLHQFELKNIEFGLLKNLADGITLMENHHYAGYGRYGSINFGAYYGGRLIALAKLSNPVRLEVASSMNLSYSEVLELDRFCIDPSYQKKNLASYFMSRLFQYVRKNNPKITHLVSFADPSHGHQGTIYKASNWKMVKITTRSYEYIDANGKSHHKKTVYNQARQLGLKELEYSQSRGLVRSYTLRKIKYVYKL